MTTSEFLASLQERPPTYNQSEEMVQNSEQASGTASANQTPRPPAASSSGGEGAESQPQASSTGREVAGSQAERGRGRPRRVRRDRSHHVTAAEGAGSEGRDPANQQGSSEAGQGEGSSSHQHLNGPASEQDKQTSSRTDSSGDGDRTRPVILVDLEFPVEVLGQQGTSEAEGQGEESSRHQHFHVPVSEQAILVDLEFPVEGLGQTGSPTVTQEQIEEIEARVRTLESLAPPPSGPGLPSPLLSAGGTGSSEDRSMNPRMNPPPPLSPPARL